MTKKGVGYLREAWPRMACCVPSAGHITTYREDLIELAFTINMMLINDEDECFNIDSGVDTYLWKYLEKVRSLPEVYNPEYKYDELKEILKKGRKVSEKDRFFKKFI